MKSSNQVHFAKAPQAQIQRSQFNRSCGLKTTFDSGYLVPVFVDEVLPGDTFNLRMTAFSRLATPMRPFMDNLYLDSQFFFVPLRLIWDNFQKMMGEQDNPGDSTDYLVPTMQAPAGGYVSQSLSDYFGIPTGVEGLEHSSLFHRAYNLIYRDWYRDENLQDSPVVDRGDGPDDPDDYVLLRRGKRHDYFTSCLPWPQKGPSVDLPLGSTAPVFRSENAPAAKLFYAGSETFPGGNSMLTGYYQTTASYLRYSDSAALSLDPNGGLYANLEDATAATINQLREAFQVQRLYERDARGGTRYTEIIRSHFGVVSPDARLQRPEYLGGGSTPVNINPVAQTSSTDATTPQGNLAAIGTASAHGHGFVKSFTEHGIIIGLVSVRADLTYQQGLNKMFSRSTRFDFFWPTLAHLGEQAVLNREIYAQGTAADDEVFGYQERYAEYRFKPSLITGKMRSQDPQSLDIWHLAQDFTSLPTLGPDFIVEQPPVERVVAVQDEPEFLFDSYFSLKCARPMPVYSTPGLIDHF
jgi:hypothetical protein